MKRSEMVGLVTAWCNFHTFKTYDEINGDRMMTLEEGDNLIRFLERQGMLPPLTRPQLEYMGLDEKQENRLFKRLSDGTIIRNPIEQPLPLPNFVWEPEDE